MSDPTDKKNSEAWVAVIVVLSAILLGFIAMRLVKPAQYGTVNWPEQIDSQHGQRVRLTLTTTRIADASMTLGSRELDSLQCDLTCQPESGDFDAAFVAFMAPILTAGSQSYKPSILLRNTSGMLVCASVPLSFTPEKSGDKVTSYKGTGKIVLRPSSVNGTRWELDWTGKTSF